MSRRRFATYVTVSLALAFGLFVGIAHAGWPPPKDDTGFDYSDPLNWPNDPEFGNQWDFWSFVPKKIQGQVDERTKRLGTGGNYDRAYAKTTGDRRVSHRRARLRHRLVERQTSSTSTTSTPASCPSRSAPRRAPASRTT